MAHHLFIKRHRKATTLQSKARKASTLDLKVSFEWMLFEGVWPCSGVALSYGLPPLPPTPQRWKRAILWTKMEWSTLESEDLNLHFFQLLWLLSPKINPRYHWLNNSRQKQSHDQCKQPNEILCSKSVLIEMCLMSTISWAFIQGKNWHLKFHLLNPISAHPFPREQV